MISLRSSPAPHGFTSSTGPDRHARFSKARWSTGAAAELGLCCQKVFSFSMSVTFDQP